MQVRHLRISATDPNASYQTWQVDDLKGYMNVYETHQTLYRPFYSGTLKFPIDNIHILFNKGKIVEISKLYKTDELLIIEYNYKRHIFLINEIKETFYGHPIDILKPKEYLSKEALLRIEGDIRLALLSPIKLIRESAEYLCKSNNGT